MDAKHYFDVEAYFRTLCDANRLARAESFRFCTCSGIESLQEPLQRFARDKAFFCVDDINDGSITRGQGGGFYKHRTITVFLMRRYTFNDEPSRLHALSVCRRLMTQLLSKLIVDAEDLENELVYLDTANVMCRELGQYFLNGCTGLYFMIDISEPVDLVYASEEWQS